MTKRQRREDNVEVSKEETSPSKKAKGKAEAKAPAKGKKKKEDEPSTTGSKGADSGNKKGGDSAGVSYKQFILGF